MKKTINLYQTIAAVGCLLLTVVACEKDFSTIESEIEGIKDFTTAGKVFPSIMYDKKLEPVQTNSLSSNLLGIYFDKIYGRTTANIVTQVVPSNFEFNFGEDPKVESVLLTIPYYSKVDGADSGGNNTYVLDSMFGSNDTYKLSIYQNTYFLRDFDPGTDLTEPQKFYSNANETINFDNYQGELFFEDDTFIPSNAPTLVTEYNEETNEEEEVSRSSPSLNVGLANTNEFWDNLFFFNSANPGSQTELSNANNFKNYFRGLYFKVEDLSGGEGNMAMLDFSQGSIVVNYSSTITTGFDEAGDPIESRDERKITMNFSGNRLNTIENSDTVKNIINSATSSTDLDNGDTNVFLKGGEGSYAVIDLFSGNVEDDEGVSVPALDYFKGKKGKWLINEANLVVYVNQNEVNNSGQEPDRVIIYDLKNNTPIIDYFLDPTVSTTNPLFSRVNYSEKLKRDGNNKGLKYKFRLTEHINNILLRDSTNLKLGIFVTTNINLTQNASVLNVPDEKVTNGSVLSPRGTVLHGSNPSVPDTKKVKFEIFYTEPNNN
ncbi:MULTISPECIES: DUF4270 domain-containing protein [Bizionia]|uniref:DUF4270 domain-containing protein n=1 Tax=Bizionia algoritergicola TaxID=291187 RepID=A0A5D0R0A2_9FLAO|nr:MULTISPECIES: DUF4270 domain-containing protein [Bizionia]OBX23540.1 hypothetical protein BAA08_04085 [Bizionia sp. APA-3]TYB74927.1 DUF4270 domain-containing protein [Bizionia algoritergicola]